MPEYSGRIGAGMDDMTETVKGALVERALDAADLLFAIESGAVAAMPLLMKASRVAREIGADRIEQWLEWEMRGYGSTEGLASQLLSHTRRWVNEAEGSAITDPLPAIEERIESLRTSLRGLGAVQGSESPFTEQEAVFFDDAAQAAVRQIGVEMQRITGQMNRLIVVRANALAMLHAFADGAFAQHRHLLPADYYTHRQVSSHRPLIAPLDGAGAGDETFSGLDVEHLQGEVLDGVPITDREADGFDGVVEEAPPEIERPESAGEFESSTPVDGDTGVERDGEEIAKVIDPPVEQAVDPEEFPLEAPEPAPEASDEGELSAELAAALDPEVEEEVSDEQTDLAPEPEQVVGEPSVETELDVEPDADSAEEVPPVSDEASDVSDGEPVAYQQDVDESVLFKELMDMEGDSEFDELSVTDYKESESDETKAESADVEEIPTEEGDEYERMMVELAGILEEPLPEEDGEPELSNSDESAEPDDQKPE